MIGAVSLLTVSNVCVRESSIRRAVISSWPHVVVAHTADFRESVFLTGHCSPTIVNLSSQLARLLSKGILVILECFHVNRVLIRSIEASLVEVTRDSVVDSIAASSASALLRDCTLYELMSLLRGAEVDEVIAGARWVDIGHLLRAECLRVLLQVQVQVGIVNLLLLFRRYTRLRPHDLCHGSTTSSNTFDGLS